MKTINDKATRDELIRRINTLDENSKAQWGKMNVYQMTKHCTLWEEMILGRKKYKQAFIGKLFGRLALKNVMKDDAPLRHSTPTVPEFVITENGDVQLQKNKWIGLIEEHDHTTNPGFIHPFFGKMTQEQMGIMAYKHADHHLRQFNA